jgi:hypothetical protein
MQHHPWDGKKIQVCCDVILPVSIWLKIMLEDLYVELLCFITVN